LRKTSQIQRIAKVAERSGKDPARVSTRALRRWILDVGSETDDNKAAALRVCVRARRWRVGNGAASAELSTIAYALEDCDDLLPRLARELAIEREDVAAALRLLTLLSCALDSAAARSTEGTSLAMRGTSLGGAPTLLLNTAERWGSRLKGRRRLRVGARVTGFACQPLTPRRRVAEVIEVTCRIRQPTEVGGEIEIPGLISGRPAAQIPAQVR
jgi:hypothetical protein